MIRNTHSLVLMTLLMMFCGVASAQNNTNSPYTRYGYGQLAEPGAANSRAMGGVAYGLRDGIHVNYANPASYTAIDSLTFIFDGSVSLQNTNFSDGRLKMNVHNSSFDYVAMQFRLAKWCGMSLGLVPFSNIGYNISESREDEQYPENSSTVTYSGEGGLHQLYLGIGFKIFKNLSVGANVSYLWGDITRNIYETFPLSASILPYSETTGVDINDYKLDFGLQYTQQFGKKHELTVGAVFSPGMDLGNSAFVQRVVGNSSLGTTSTVTDTVATFEVPMTIGVGLGYVYDNRLTVGADFMMQNWEKSSYMNDANAFCKRTRISAGAEYIPNPFGRNYLARIKYRIGGYYSQPYYKIAGSNAAKEYGVSAGFGLPIPRTRSLISISAQYVKTKGSQAAFLDENTLRICVGITFNERWFFKRRVD